MRKPDANVTRIGLIGFGAIGHGLCELVDQGAVPAASIAGVLVRDSARFKGDSSATHLRFLETLDELIELRPDVIVDAASHEALQKWGAPILRLGIDLISVNAGALVKDEVMASLRDAAIEGGSRLLLCSGAIAGLDALESAAQIGIDNVTHTVRKPPEALLSAQRCRVVRKSNQEVVLFRGSAREAIGRFPQNVNVVALVAFAGIGLDMTQAVVIADPAVSRNMHEVLAVGRFGRILVQVENVPSPRQPRTGLIVAGSVARTLRRLGSPLVVGA